MTIGELAKRVGVNIQTIRYYERKGLIPEPARKRQSGYNMSNSPGYRDYTENFVALIKFMKRAQAAGFTLREVQELLALRIDSKTRCGEVRRHVDEKVADIDGKVRSLKQIETVLIELSKACRSRTSTSDCPILDAFHLNNQLIGIDLDVFALLFRG